MDDEDDYKPGLRLRDVPFWIALAAVAIAGTVFMERVGFVDHAAIQPSAVGGPQNP
jgi:hypothetical protein